MTSCFYPKTGFPLLSALFLVNFVESKRPILSLGFTSSSQSSSLLRNVFSKVPPQEPEPTTLGTVGALMSPGLISQPALRAKPKLDLDESDGRIRIGIIGGGIAGVTAAHSIARFMQGRRDNVDVIILEGDDKGGGDMRDCDILKGKSPDWIAATARNANSIVPDSSMHIYSHRGALYDVLRDTFNDWVLAHWDNFKNSHRPNFVKRIDSFATPPPYFAVHPIRCLGPSASWDERMSFLRFSYHFLVNSVIKDDENAARRGDHQVQLAKANRVALLNHLSDIKILETEIGYSPGFLSLHRTIESAKFSAKETRDVGDFAEVLEWKSAIEMEPRLEHIPNKMYVVHRSQDFTASCEIFIRKMVQQCNSMGVKYMNALVTDLVVADRKNKSPKKRRFRITTADGDEDSFDVLVLAAGINTPLWASRIGAGNACPTYPIRGYSLTIFQKDNDRNSRTKSLSQKTLLNHAFSLDSMYCSSVTPNMARIAGFGELVGYREKAVHAPSVGPRVLERYCKTLFPDATDVSRNDAQQCFRPTSPDDLPLVGSVSKHPGLFLHTGHGTLGWTTALSTAECLAQDISDHLDGGEKGELTFVLPDETKIDRAVLSPNRFT